MEFTLTDSDAAALREFAALEPAAARSWLQDRPELARRMVQWPPELRIEVCRMLYLSFDEAKRSVVASRRRAGSNLLDLLEGPQD